MFDIIRIKNASRLPTIFGSLDLNSAQPETPSPGTSLVANDSQEGTDGLDVFIQESLRDSDTLNGGAGRDTVDYSRAVAGNGALGGIELALDIGRVRKYEDGRLTGTDTLISIERVVGTRYNDTMRGSADADELDGDAGNDLLDGGEGRDTIHGGDGDDRISQSDWSSSTTMAGGDGFDTLDYSNLEVAAGLTVNLAIATVTKGQYGALSGTDTISSIEAVTGTAYDDTLLGDASANKLDGGDGNDTLNAGAGNDVVIGGAGHDHIVQNDAGDSDTINGGEGIDRLSYMDADVELHVDLVNGKVQKFRAQMLVGTDIITGIEHVVGTRHDDTLSGSDRAEELGGFDGDDDIKGGGGNDTLRGYFGNDMMTGDAGNDSMEGGSGQDDMTGGDGDDTMTGDDAADVMLGGAGDDSLVGGAGQDLLRGGVGENTIEGGNGDDYIMEYEIDGHDSINGGGGVDMLDYSGITVSSYLSIGLLVDLVAGRVSTNISLFSALKDNIRNIENVTGTAANDRLIGDANDNLLYGGGGSDFIDGAAGDDVLDGGAGNDTLRAGAGDDSFIMSTFRGSGQIDGGDGSDTVFYQNKEAGARVVVDLSAGTVQKFINDAKVGGDKINNVERIIGTINADKITGSANADELKGGAGNDTLSGAGGKDVVLGEEGDDYFVGTWMLNTTMDGGDGVDTLDYSKLRAAAENSGLDIDLQTGIVAKVHSWQTLGIDSIANFELVTGSSFDDTIHGDAGANTLRGAGGDDMLDGAGGSDSIEGGDGEDLIAGNPADDSSTIDGGNNIDTLVYGGAAGGIDVDLWSGKVFKYRDDEQRGVDTIRNIEAVVGGSYDDTLAGSDNIDRLSGVSGDDVLSGAGGSDNLHGGEGNDTLNGEAGNDLLDGDVGADSLSGGDGNDLIYGRDGEDILNGGAGTDVIRAGLGDDRIVQNDMDDSNTFDGAEGFDTLDYRGAAGNEARVNVNFVSASVIKYVGTRQLGTDTINSIEAVFGTRNNDTVIGSADFERIETGAGNDSINSGAGNDMIFAGDGDDRVAVTVQAAITTMDGGDGSDMLDYSGMTMGVEVDLFQKTATKGMVGIRRTDIVTNFECVTGSNFADIVNGDAQANRIIGGGGDDTISGDAGNDTLLGGGSNDMIVQGVLSVNDNDAIDGGLGFNKLSYILLGSAISVDMTDRIVKKMGADNLIATDTFANIGMVIGSTLNDTLTGSSKEEYLQGWDGNDSISGDNGDDKLLGQRGNDTVIGGAGNDVVGGDEGDDVVSGGAGNDSVVGGDGDDRFIQNSEPGVDELYGDAGFDIVDYSGAPLARIRLTIDLDLGTVTSTQSDKTVKVAALEGIEGVIGTQNNDLINGSKYANSLVGNGGNDYLDGLASDDTMTGGAGSDTMIGGDGKDAFIQDADSAIGDDSINGGSDNDKVIYDKMEGYIRADLTAQTVVKMNGVEVTGTDTLKGIEILTGTQRNDYLIGGAGFESLSGRDGNDTIAGKGGNDFLGGDDGNDSLNGDDGSDKLSGGSGADSLTGGAGNDELMGGAGDDVYYFDRGFGQDVIINKLVAGSTEDDVVKFISAAAANIQFQRQGNALKIYVEGDNDTITFASWYGESDSTEPHDHVSSFETVDLSLSAERLDAIVTISGAAPVSMWDILMAA